MNFSLKMLILGNLLSDKKSIKTIQEKRADWKNGGAEGRKNSIP